MPKANPSPFRFSPPPHPFKTITRKSPSITIDFFCRQPANSSSQSISRPKRDPGRPFAEWGIGEKLHVQLYEENQSIDDMVAKLQSQLGIIARNGNFAPITFTDWRAPELDAFKDRIWEEVKCRINERLSEVLESSQSATFRDEVFTEVLGADGHSRVRTYGLGPCPSQVFGRYTRSQDQCVDMDKMRPEMRQELLAELDDRFTKRKCSRLEAHVESIGYPMAQSSDTDEPDNFIPTCNMRHGSDASSSN